MNKTKKNFKTLVCIFLLSALLISVFAMVFGSAQGIYATSDKGMLINGEGADADLDIGNGGNSIYDPDAFMNNIHAGDKNGSHYLMTSKTLNVTQFSQSSLNYYYNSHHSGVNVNGTCGCVALATLTYYYRHGLVGYGNLPSNINDIFETYIDMYGITGNEGTYSNTYKTKLKDYFARYGYNMTTERVTAINKFTKMRSDIDGNRPIIIAVSGSEPYGSHAMVVVGYRKYKVTKKNWLGITTTSEETMFAIDEGWGRGRYAYLHEDHMPKDWEITRMWKA